MNDYCGPSCPPSLQERSCAGERRAQETCLRLSLSPQLTLGVGEFTARGNTFFLCSQKPNQVCFPQNEVSAGSANTKNKQTNKHIVLNPVSSTPNSELRHLTGIHYPGAGTETLAICSSKWGCYLSLKKLGVSLITGSIPCLSPRGQTTQTSLGKNKNLQHLINAKPAAFEETLLRWQQKKKRPSQIEVNTQHLIPEGQQTSTHQPNLTCHSI